MNDAVTLWLQKPLHLQSQHPPHYNYLAALLQHNRARGRPTSPLLLPDLSASSQHCPHPPSQISAQPSTHPLLRDGEKQGWGPSSRLMHFQAPLVSLTLLDEETCNETTLSVGSGLAVCWMWPSATRLPQKQQQD